MSTELLLLGGAAADNFIINRNGSAINVYQNEPLTATPTQSISASDIGPINIVGNGGSDTVTVDYSGGDPIPGGLTFDAIAGGLAQPTLAVTGVAAGTGYAPQYSLSSNAMTIANPAINDTINFANVSSFNLFGSTGSASLEVADGSPVFTQDLGASGASVNVTVDAGASISFGSTQHLNSLTVQSNGSAAMLPAGGQVLVTNTLTVDGTLDLANNDLIVNTPSSADMTTLQEAVAAGVTGSATQGIIYSSTAATDGMTIGVAPALHVAVSELDGSDIPSGALVARYTMPGDASLSGIVNFNDFAAVLQNYGKTLGTTPPQWYSGDFDYTGNVNFSDFAAVLRNYGSTVTGQPVTTGVGQAFNLSLPTTTPTGTPITRWDINWGDGTNDTYPASVTSASHTYTQIGLADVQFNAVTDDPTTGYGTYTAPAQSLVITNTGVTAAAVTFAASASTDTFTITSDGSGDTLISQNGTIVLDEPTEDILSLSITGHAAAVTVDFTNGDPLPLSGLYSDAAVIQLNGPHGSDDLVTTSTAAYIGSDEVRYPATTQLADNLTSDGGVFAVAGTTNASFPSHDAVTVAPGATLLIKGSQSLSALNVYPGATARLVSPSTSAPAVLVISQLNLEQGDSLGNYQGVLDAGIGQVVIAPGNAGSTFILARFNPDGSLDTTFGDDGFVVGTLGSSGLGGALSSDGTSFVIGTAADGTSILLPLYEDGAEPDVSVGTVLSGRDQALYYTGAFTAIAAGGAIGALGAVGAEAGLAALGFAISVPVTLPLIIGAAAGYELYHYAVWGTWGL